MQLVNSENPILKRVCSPVSEGLDIRNIIEGMYKILKIENGVGLAAPQVGLDMRVIIIRCASVDMAIINPVLTPCKKTKIVTSKGEGCLSFPNKRVNMKRYKRVILEGFDADWNPVRMELKNLLAFIAQHECDHLNGITIV